MLIHHGTCTRLVISVVILYLALSGCSIVQSQEPLSFTATDGTPAASVGGTAGVSTQPAKAGQNAGAPARKGTATSAPTPLRLWLSTELPDDIRAPIEKWAGDRKALIVAAGQQADLRISGSESKGALPLAERVYAAAASFYTIRPGTSLAELRSLWAGGAAKAGARIVASDSTVKALSGLLGQPGAAVIRVQPQDLSTQVGKTPDGLALLPFDQLVPQLSALPVDRYSPLARDLDLKQYPLVARYWVSGDSRQSQAFVQALRPLIPATNRDPQRMTTLVMTGVTAMARGTAYVIERQGDPAYPARQIAEVVSSADITHISNEIPFFDGCQPSLDPDLLILCSKPSYMAALKLAGTDIVGLTGNHMLDYGPDAIIKTLDLYDKEKIRYYAGGRNAEEAKRPLIVVDHGNRLAFLGANSFGPASDWAGETSPGSLAYDPEEIRQAIQAARKQADLVLVEYQAEETYDYAPSYLNQKQFRATLAAGADVVTGVQSHVPQAVEFTPDGRRVILYGLGNLFFDQMYNDMVRQGLIARHTIYAGHLLQTELLVTMLEHYSQPRWATAAERLNVLNSVFEASQSIMP